MSAIFKTNHFVSIKDYLVQELIAETKHEHTDGAIYAIAGASKNHESICGNVLAEMHQCTSIFQQRLPRFIFA